MAAPGNYVVPDKAKLNMLALALLNAGNTFKLTLHTSAFTPNDSANEVFSDLAGELATGNGYTAGGIVVPNAALTLTSGVVKFTHNAAVWTAAGGSIPAWRNAYLRVVGTFGGKVDPLIARFIGDATPTDVPATTAGNTITVTPPAVGVIAFA